MHRGDAGDGRTMGVQMGGWTFHVSTGWSCCHLVHAFLNATAEEVARVEGSLKLVKRKRGRVAEYVSRTVGKALTRVEELCQVVTDKVQ